MSDDQRAQKVESQFAMEPSIDVDPWISTLSKVRSKAIRR